MKININFKNEHGLCGSCQNSQVMTDTRDDQQMLCFNTHPAIQIPRPLKHCSSYEAKGIPSRHDLERIAWVLEFSKGKPIGFRAPKDSKD